MLALCLFVSALGLSRVSMDVTPCRHTTTDTIATIATATATTTLTTPHHHHYHTSCLEMRKCGTSHERR
jgi:hypothetical protein